MSEYIGLAAAWLIVILANLEKLRPEKRAPRPTAAALRRSERRGARPTVATLRRLKQRAAPLTAAVVGRLERRVARLTAAAAGRSEKRGARLTAAGIILLSTIATGYSARVIWQLNDRRPIERAQSDAVGRFFQEASGGSRLDDDEILLVDDEVPAILHFVANGNGELLYQNRLQIFENGQPVGNERVDDLEGIDDLEGLAVSANGRYVYVTTSHSNNKDGHRRTARNFVLRGCLRLPDRFIVLDRVSLAGPLIRKIFHEGVAKPFYVPQRDDRGRDRRIPIRMEVEGLAADRYDNLYFGLRAPLSKDGDHAIIASIAASRLFPDTPLGCLDGPARSTPVAEKDIRLFEMPLHMGGASYGIVSMEFDRGELVLLGNSPRPFEALRPIACRWNPAMQPSSRRCTFLPETKEPYWGKQEALVLGTPGDKATVFIDSDKGLGGWVTYERDDLAF